MALAQTGPSATPALPAEPAQIFAAAAPLYDFNVPGLKPWRLKVSYQLYDDKGDPSETGTYEHWWASPERYRSTWKRGAMEHSDWHVDGLHYTSGSVFSVPLVERKLQSDLLTPLPKSEAINGDKFHFARQEQTLGATKLQCVMLIPKMQSLPGKQPVIPMGMFPTYCFEPERPALRAYYSYGGTSVVYNKIARSQGRFLPLDFAILDGKRKVITAKIDSVSNLDPASPDLAPPQGVTGTKPAARVVISSGVAQAILLKKVRPDYPQDAKDAGAEGTVVVQVLIGTDGRTHDLSIVQAPYPSLAAAAITAVMQWEYNRTWLTENRSK